MNRVISQGQGQKRARQTSKVILGSSSKRLFVNMDVRWKTGLKTVSVSVCGNLQHTHVKISQLVNKMFRNRLVASLSTSCNNAVILSSCYKVVTHNLLTNCCIAG